MTSGYTAGATAPEIMIWVDKAGLGNDGATLYGHVTIGGRAFTLYTYGPGEIIVSLNRNETSGTVLSPATLKWLQAHGLVSSSRRRPGRFWLGNLLNRRQAGNVHGQQIQPDKQVRDQRLHGLMRGGQA